MNNVVSLNDLFHKRVFRVPDYQRGYSWEERQVQEFLEDLELLGSRRYHYTGTVVLHEPHSEPDRMDEDGNAYVPVEIVDGQQRLTTIVLLLDGIRRSLAGFSNKAAKRLSRGIEKNFIVAREETSRQLIYKLSLNEDTDHFFKSSVLSEQPSVEGPQITSERRLEAAKNHIADHLATNINTMGTNGEEWLRTLYSKVVNQLRFSLYQVEDEAEVGVIFEVMNDRGKPLTELEKVKNYLLHTSTYLDVPNDLAKSVNAAWAKILRQLMAANLVSSADEDRLLRAHWLTHYNYQSRQWEGSRSVKGRFELRKYKSRHADLLDDLHGYVQGLRTSCVSFCDAYEPHRPDAFGSFKNNSKAREQVVDWSAKLARVGVIPSFLPILLAVRERWPTDPDRYLEILKLCEAFAFRVYRLKGSRADAGQATLFRLGYDLAHKSEEFDGAILHFKRALVDWCEEEEFETLTREGHQQVREAYDWRGLRYFLYEYEIALASDEGASPIVKWDEFQSKDLKDTIEHVLPQSIDNQRYWRKRFRKSRHQRYVHDLGNLTLTKHNSYYLNKPFPDKKGAVDAEKHCYAKSPLYVERELTQWEDWNASAINERRAKLLKWARGRWAVDLSELEDFGEELDVPTVEDWRRTMGELEDSGEELDLCDDDGDDET